MQRVQALTDVRMRLVFTAFCPDARERLERTLRPDGARRPLLPGRAPHRHTGFMGLANRFSGASGFEIRLETRC